MQTKTCLTFRYTLKNISDIHKIHSVLNWLRYTYTSLALRCCASYFSLAGSRRKSLRNCTKMFCKLYPRGRFLTDTGSPLSHLFLFSLFLSLPRMLLSSSWSCKFFMGFLRGKGVGCLKMPFCKVQDKMSHFFKPQGPLALCSYNPLGSIWNEVGKFHWLEDSDPNAIRWPGKTVLLLNCESRGEIHS